MVVDVIGFTGVRLWISSANFTRSSPRNLELGFWTEEPTLLDGAQRFLVQVMASSEGVDSESTPLRRTLCRTTSTTRRWPTMPPSSDSDPRH